MSLATIDLTSTPKALILGLINRVNSLALTDADVTIGVPSVIVADAEGRNTKLTVTATEASEYETGSTVDVTYRRIPLSDLTNGKATSAYTIAIKGAAANSTTKISDIIDELNTLFGTNITADDYVDLTIPAGAAKSTVSFTMTAATGSLIYQDSVTLYVTYNAAKLSEVVTTTTLDGFVYS